MHIASAKKEKQPSAFLHPSVHVSKKTPLCEYMTTHIQGPSIQEYNLNLEVTMLTDGDDLGMEDNTFQRGEDHDRMPP